MKTIIAGSRSANSYKQVDTAMATLGIIPTLIVSGAASGADRLGEQWAKSNNIPVKRFPANWDEHGRSAGYLRNSEMAVFSDVLVAFWDGRSNGTAHMIKCARSKRLLVYVFDSIFSDATFGL